MADHRIWKPDLRRIVDLTVCNAVSILPQYFSDRMNPWYGFDRSLILRCGTSYGPLTQRYEVLRLERRCSGFDSPVAYQ